MSLTRTGAREAFLVLHLGLPEDKDPGEAGRAEEQWGDSSEIGNARPAFPLARGPPLLPVPRAGGAKRRSANVHNDILLRADVRREGGGGTDGNLRSVSVVLSPGDASDTA